VADTSCLILLTWCWWLAEHAGTAAAVPQPFTGRRGTMAEDGACLAMKLPGPDCDPHYAQPQCKLLSGFFAQSMQLVPARAADLGGTRGATRPSGRAIPTHFRLKDFVRSNGTKAVIHRRPPWLTESDHARCWRSAACSRSSSRRSPATTGAAICVTPYVRLA
jgi:hypothetical protein